MESFIRLRAEALLAGDFCCDAEALRGREVVFTVRSDAARPYVKLLAYRNAVVVCTSPGLRERAAVMLLGRTRDEMFECPLVYGQTLHYVPDRLETDCAPDDEQAFELLFGKQLRALAGLTGFENSLAFDADGGTPTQAACFARAGGEIVGIAGAAETAVPGLWEVGVDVREDHRNAGLGTRLVRRLTRELLRRKIAPFYSASVTNLASQRVAGRCGYIPLWVDTYGTTLDGSYAYDDIVQAALPHGSITQETRFCP